jgi:hypothetical protein
MVHMIGNDGVFNRVFNLVATGAGWSDVIRDEYSYLMDATAYALDAPMLISAGSTLAAKSTHAGEKNCISRAVLRAE